jgi:hypothetical protein
MTKSLASYLTKSVLNDLDRGLTGANTEATEVTELSCHIKSAALTGDDIVEDNSSDTVLRCNLGFDHPRTPRRHLKRHKRRLFLGLSQ